MVPTKEEELKLCSYKGAVDELGSAEKFLRALVGIPFAFQRAEAMLYRETFEDEVVHLRSSFSMLEVLQCLVIFICSLLVLQATVMTNTKYSTRKLARSLNQAGYS